MQHLHHTVNAFLWKQLHQRKFSIINVCSVLKKFLRHNRTQIIKLKCFFTAARIYDDLHNFMHQKRFMLDLNFYRYERIDECYLISQESRFVAWCLAVKCLALSCLNNIRFHSRPLLFRGKDEREKIMKRTLNASNNSFRF